MTYRACRPSIWISLLIFAALLCGFPTRAGAQTPGAIGGTVTDQSGAVLKGAQISMQAPALTAFTNEQGQFYLNDLAPGTYDLTVTYVGLAPFTTSVTVNAGETANVQAQLRVATRGEAVVVSAARASAEAEAINEERAADNLLQVMPTQIITSLPNANLADAIGRLPSVTLSGMRAKANTFMSAAPSRASPTPQSTALICLPKSPAYARSSSTPFPPALSSPCRSARPCRRIWRATASAAR